MSSASRPINFCVAPGAPIIAKLAPDSPDKITPRKNKGKRLSLFEPPPNKLIASDNTILGISFTLDKATFWVGSVVKKSVQYVSEAHQSKNKNTLQA